VSAHIDIHGYRPKHLSWSTYNTYSECGERQRLQKVLMLEQHPNWGSCGGTAVHDSIELIEHTAPDLGPLDDWRGLFSPTILFNNFFNDAIEDTLKRSPSHTTADFYVSPNRGKPKDEAWWRTEGPLMVDRWFTWREETRWEPWHTPAGRLAVELECNFTLPGDIPIKAFIDSVWTLPTGQLAVCDVKSGKIPDSTGQLGLYRVALKTLFDVDVDWGFFWDAKKGTHGQPLDLTSWTPEYLGELFDQAIRGHNAGVFLPKPAMNCGTWCGTARYCAAVGGELAHTVPSARELLDIRNKAADV
jgi:hypothetical protein